MTEVEYLGYIYGACCVWIGFKSSLQVYLCMYRFPSANFRVNML